MDIAAWTVVGPLVRFLSWLPGWFSRWYWSDARLAAKIKIAVCTDRRGVFVNGGDIPSVDLNLEVTNFLPFDVTVEVLWCDLVFLGGRIAHLRTRLTRMVKATSHEIVHLEATMTGPQREFLQRLTERERDTYVKQGQLRVLLEGELNSKVRRFQLWGRELAAPAPEFVNLRHRDAAA
jgi:hypothetical protein